MLILAVCVDSMSAQPAKDAKPSKTCFIFLVGWLNDNVPMGERGDMFLESVPTTLAVAQWTQLTDPQSFPPKTSPPKAPDVFIA